MGEIGGFQRRAGADGGVRKRTVGGGLAQVRSENDYGPDAELGLAAKRADYFAAGTLVVWDVDVLRGFEIRAYRADRPDQPDVFRRGDRAHAEPALPGWSMPVDELEARR